MRVDSDVDGMVQGEKSGGTPVMNEQQAADAAREKWPNPTPEMLDSPVFEAIWRTIQRWDIAVPSAYGGYCSATGNHVRAIMDALSLPDSPPDPRDKTIAWPAVDISMDSVKERASLLRRNGMCTVSADMLEALAAERTRLAREIARRSARDKTPASRQLLNLSEALRESAESECAEKDATIARLSAELAAAHEALEPFAPIIDLPYQDDKPVVLKFYDRENCETLVPFGVWGNFRLARAVLAKLSKEK